MNKQKKPLYYYYLIILIVLLGINLVFTMFRGDKIKNVNYNDFMKQIEQHQINEVEIGDQNITYSLKGETKQLYKTETMETDTSLSQRLYDAGAKFTRIHTKEMNPLLSFLLTFILPVAFLWWLGNRMFKKMQKKMGEFKGWMNWHYFSEGQISSFVYFIPQFCSVQLSSVVTFPQIV